MQVEVDLLDQRVQKGLSLISSAGQPVLSVYVIGGDVIVAGDGVSARGPSLLEALRALYKKIQETPAKPPLTLYSRLGILPREELKP